MNKYINVLHVNIFKYILYVCVYIHNKYTQSTYTYYVTKRFILDVKSINRLTALKSVKIATQ